MPYIVTTTRVRPPSEFDKQVGESRRMHEQSRRAVATLDEAQDAVFDYLNATAGHDRVPGEAALRITEQGGTVGPLPDGTVIEVERVDWDTLAWNEYAPGPTNADHSHARERIVAAYNAAQD